MKVVLATCMAMPHTGGASTHFELLTRSLNTAGMLGGVVVGQDGRPSRSGRVLCALRAFGVRDAARRELLIETARLLTKAIDRRLESTPADIVHCHDALAAYAAVNTQAAKTRVLKVIQTVHGPWSKEALTSGIGTDSHFFRKAREIEAHAYARCAGFIAVDRGQADILIGEFGVPKGMVSVIHNAVDCEEIGALARRPCTHKIPEPYFVVPRRLVPKNGVHVAIEALSMLEDERIHLAIAGDGPLEGDLRELAQRNKVSDRVSFLGNLSKEQLMPLMAGSSGVIVPSVPADGVIEATSLAVIEAFACGVPVIASNIGGLAELIQDRVTGLLFPAGDAPALAENVRFLLGMQPTERLRLCTVARDAALAKWDVLSWFRQTCNAYQAPGEGQAGGNRQ